MNCNYFNNISQIVAFGDSYTDNGEAFRISKEIVSLPNPPKDAYIKPGPGYWCNRYSNGYVAVENFAHRLNLPLVDYAVGGATTGYKNYSDWMDTLGYTGLLGQVTRYTKLVNGSMQNQKNLYFIFAGTNDYYRFTDFKDPSTIEEATTNAVENIKTAIYKLIDIGAKNFFVVNCIDLSLLPYEIQQNQTKLAKSFTTMMNTKLSEMLKTFKSNPNVIIVEFDIEKISDYIANHPEKYGITNINKPCKPIKPDTIPKQLYPCMANNCLFWDDYHASAKAHCIYSYYMYISMCKNKKMMFY